MLRKTVCTVAVFAICVGFAWAENFVGIIKKVEDGKISIAKFKGKFKKGEKPQTEDVTLNLAKGAKAALAKFNKEEKKLEAGNDIPLKNLKAGTFARFTTNDDGQVTDILVFPKFGKKKKKDD